MKGASLIILLLAGKLASSAGPVWRNWNSPVWRDGKSLAWLNGGGLVRREEKSSVRLSGSDSVWRDGNAGRADSLLPVRNAWAWMNVNEFAGVELSDVEANYLKTGNTRGAFAGLVNLVRLRNSFWSNRMRARLFNDLAGVSVRLKLYPIAMKCYGSEHFGADSAFYHQLTDLDTSILTNPSSNISNPVPVNDILASFEDGKTAASYAILVHVKQPVPGKRKAFTHVNNVGHMFITLIKYNEDNSYVSRSFGFYPQKTGLLSATPLHPASASAIKDDSGHDWDEVAGKFISFRRFRRVLEVLQSYDQRSYDLRGNNCTDFGLTLAGIGGIMISDTRGRWPLGKGNNPGSAGQSMLEGKLTNADAEEAAPLFVNNMAAIWTP